MAAFATSHNGCRSQVNGNAIQTGGDYPFLNFMKTCQMWSYPNVSGVYVDFTTLDANGYPTTLPSGGVTTRIYVPSQANFPGDMVMTWDGTGVVIVDGVITLGNTSTSGVQFTPSGTSLTIGILSTSASPNHVRNMKLSYVGAETTALNAGDVFRPDFKNKLLQGGFGVYRFLNWQNANFSNVTTWAMRTPITYYSYHTSQIAPSMVCTGCTNSGNAYSITGNGLGVPSSGAPADKQLIQLQFNANATAAPCTLNLNGTGTKPILNKYSNPLSSYSYPTTLQFAGTVGSKNFATMMYDADLGAWIKYGGDDTDQCQGVISGCPPEIMFQLCAELGAHPYFVTPPFTIDPATDYMGSLATYCRDNGPSWMVPRYEGPNENFNNLFIAFNYANNKATAYAGLAAAWTGADYINWQGKILSVLGQIVSTVYSADRTRYHVLCGVQTFTGGAASNSNNALNSAAYFTQTLAAQSPYTKSRAKDWVTGICCAQYFSPSDETSGSVRAHGTDMAAQYAAGNTYAVTSYIRGIYEQASSFNLQSLANNFSAWKTWAQGFGVNYMTGYEGGYSPDYDSNGTSSMDILRAASKNTPDAAAGLLSTFTTFVNLSDATFKADFPSNFIMAEITTFHVWPILFDIYQTPDPPLWTALRSFSGKRSRLILHT